MNHKNRDKDYWDPNREGPFAKATRPVGPPRQNTLKIPYEQWNWSLEDPDFYRSFMRLPDSEDKSQYNAVKWNRWQIATNSFPGVDRRPGALFKKMKLEMFVIFGSIIFGLSNHIIINKYSVAWYCEKGLRKEDKESVNVITASSVV